MQQDRLDEAEEDFKQVLRMDPANDVAYTNMGMLLIQQGKPGNAGIS